jgi:uncharacterized RDD family membrane protein YckC
MSITPLPNLPSEPEGIHLSALDSYLVQPGALSGVTFWPRAAARVLDLVIHYFIAAGSGFFVGVMLGIVASLRDVSVRTLLAHRTPDAIWPFVFALLGSIAFEAICEGFHGSTPGKFCLSMVVMQEDGTPCRLGSAWIRSFAYLIDSLFFGLVGYFHMEKSPQEQRHGDDWAHTVVCRRSDIAPHNLRGGGQFALALFLAALADAALVIVGLVVKLTA